MSTFSLSRLLFRFFSPSHLCLGRLPNGVQGAESGNSQQRHAVSSGGHEPMEVSGLTSHLLPQGHTPYTHHGNRQVQPVTPPSPQLSNSLPREDQESLLHAHFSSATGPSSSQLHTSRGSHAHGNNSSLTPETDSRQPALPMEADAGSLEIGSNPPSSNFLSTFTQLPPQATSQSLPAIGPPHTLGVTILPSSHGPVEYSNHIPSAPPGDAPLHEVTQVTHSIQAPISSLTPLPNEGGCG